MLEIKRLHFYVSSTKLRRGGNMIKVKNHGKVVDGLMYRKVCAGEYELYINGEETGVFFVKAKKGWDILNMYGEKIGGTIYNLENALRNYAWDLKVSTGMNILD